MAESIDMVSAKHGTEEEGMIILKGGISRTLFKRRLRTRVVPEGYEELIQGKNEIGWV